MAFPAPPGYYTLYSSPETALPPPPPPADDATEMTLYGAKVSFFLSCFVWVISVGFFVTYVLHLVCCVCIWFVIQHSLSGRVPSLEESGSRRLGGDESGETHIAELRRLVRFIITRFILLYCLYFFVRERESTRERKN